MRLEPWMFDLVLLGVAGEGVLIWTLLRRTRQKAWIRPVAWFLVSGALLMAAVRGVIAGLPHAAIAGILFASLLTHLACLYSAWRLIRARD
jgi:hypothetical protein